MSARARVLLGAVVAVILLVTLYPASDREIEPWSGCLICGTRGTADAILNVFLFLPLGAALALNGVRIANATALTFALSLSIEVTQLGIPGRDPSFGDLFFNTVGGALGAFLIRARGVWLTPDSGRAARLSAAAAGAVLAVVLATGWLVGASLPQTRYYGQWTPELGHLDPYHGRVLDARIGDFFVPGTAPPEQEELRERIRRGEPVAVRAIAAYPPAGLASIFSIYDENSSEILLVGPSSTDLVYRQRMRATALRLTTPAYRARGLMWHVTSGDTVAIRVEREGNRVCLAVNDREECGLGFTVSAGRRLLYNVESWRIRYGVLLDATWMLLLLLPFGFWARARKATYAGAVVLVGALFLAPVLAGLLIPTPYELGGALAGVLLGLGLRRLTDRAVPGERPGIGPRRALREHAQQLGEAPVDA